MRILIRGESVYDGTGAAPVACDILTEDGFIKDIGHNIAAAGSDLTVIKGKTVCPGFIDIHRHADTAVFSSPYFGKTELLQGITSIFSGNCGLSSVPGNHRWSGEYYQYLEPMIGRVPPDLRLDNYTSYRKCLGGHPLPVNFGFLAAAGAIKTAVKGFSKSPFSPEEMEAAQKLIRNAFEAGASGISFGLMYQPECYSGNDELITLAKTAAAFKNAILCIHIRGEGDSLPDSIEEAIRISEAANIPVNISHFKSTGIKNWRRLIYTAIEKIEAARSRGLEITADFYPYDGGSTSILSLIPPVFYKDGQNLWSVLADKNNRDSFRREINSKHPGWDNMVLGIGWERLIICSASLPEHNSFCGKNMEAIAREQGFADPADLLAELTASEQGRVGIIALSMDWNDIDSVARLPWTCLVSDSLYCASGNPHPRLNGAFPKFIREYVRERRLFSMEEAVYKMTGMPAERMKLKNRGKLLPGYAADILVFDPEKFRDNADYANSSALASGMDTVILNGKIVYNENEFFEPNGEVI